jgi:galactose mutarotase-like enzyme
MNSRLIPISQGDQRAWIYPEHGFQLYGYEQKLKNKNISVIHAPNLDREPADRRYGNPILFPAPSMTCSSHGKDTWVLDGKVLPMPGHGVARNCYWHVVDVQSNSVTGEFVPNSNSTICFPFEFKLRLTYKLDSEGLVLDALLENTGRDSFPYAFGLHPYLNAPLSDKGKVSDCSVSLPKAERLVSKDGWLSFQKGNSFGPARVPADQEDLGTTLMLVNSGAKFLDLEDSANQLKVRVSVEKSPQTFPVWAVWSPTPETRYICLEPWSDYPNMLNRKETRRCAPGEKHAYQMVISVSSL